jgi:hypothetical protein
LFIPWPIAGFAVFVSFSSQYSILLGAVAVIIEIILVLYYRKKIDIIINKESYNENEEEAEKKEMQEKETRKLEISAEKEKIKGLKNKIIKNELREDELKKELTLEKELPKKKTLEDELKQIKLEKKGLKKELAELKKKIAPFKSKNNEVNSFVEGFAIIVIVFGAIAGLALTQAMIDFSDQCINEKAVYVYTITKRTPCFDKVTSLQQLPELLSNDQMLLVISFFIIGTSFYHCGIMFLNPKTMVLVGEGDNKLITVNCLILFAESVTLFFAATSSDSIEKFSLWIILLLFLDISWGLLNFFHKDSDEILSREKKDKKRLNALYIGWAHLDGILLMFFITTLIFLTSAGGKPVTAIEDGTWIHVVLLLVSASVIITIYEIGWPWFWAKFKTIEG